MYYTKATVPPYNRECRGCLFVSVEGGCDVSSLCGRSRKGIFRELGYTGSGGYDCPMRAETAKDFTEKVKRFVRGGGLIKSWRRGSFWH